MITLGSDVKREARERLREFERQLFQNIYERCVKSQEKKIAEQSRKFPTVGEKYRRINQNG